MIEPRWEEEAALAALGWSDNPAELDRASAQDPEIAASQRDFAEVVALLACEAPQHAPHSAMRDRILRRLDAPRPAARSRILQFPRTVLPYALAACLMGLVLIQAALLVTLNHRLNSPQHVMPAGMQLADLAPQGDHGKAKIMVAWDPQRCCGMVSMDDMPPPPPGHDYQLWVLDPSKATPVSAGVVPRGVRTEHFVAAQVRMPGRPGFAVSLEPAGGRPTPTAGSILFAVAPSP
jgi:anti-sigma-K factor RskA